MSGAPEGLINDILPAVVRVENKQYINEDDNHNFNAMSIIHHSRARLDVDGLKNGLFLLWCKKNACGDQGYNK